MRPSIIDRCAAKRQRYTQSFFRALALLALSALAYLPRASATESKEQENDLAPSRFAFSSSMFVDVNENDAKASMKILAQAMGSDHGIPVDPTIQALAGPDAIRNAYQAKLIDAITMPVTEYWMIRKEAPLSTTVFGLKDGVCTEEYLLLVNQASGIERIGDLRGKNVVFLKNPRACLAPYWVEILLLEEHLGRASAFWHQITFEAKLTRVVLPLFFRQIDACVTTRSGFQLMVELNPQVGKQLKILATSPAVVPVVFGFRGDYISPYRDKLSVVVNNIADTVAGRQILTLFQSEGMTRRPITELDSAMQMMDLHKRLCSEVESSANGNAVLKLEKGGRR